MLFTAVTFIAFTALVAVIAWWRTRNDDLSTQDGYFLAGRSLTGPVIAGSLMLTNLSTEQLIGQTGQSFSTNMGPIAWEVTSAAALVILALVFLPRYLKMGLTTIPEFLENRYDSITKRIVSIMFLLGYLLTYLPTVLYSGALVFNQIFEVDKRMGVSQMQGVIITAIAIGIVGACYAIFGGLKAVAVSDTINGIGLIIGGFMIPIFGLLLLGNDNFLAGLRDLISVVPAEKFNAINPASAMAPMIPWPVLFTGMVVNNMFYWCTNQAIIQRTLGAKNLREAQRGAIFAGFLKCCGPFFITICGLICYRMSMDPTEGFFSAEHIANLATTSDLAYPTLILNVLPKPLLGFFAAVLFGAILSSFNSALNSSVTLYTLDIHRPLFNPNATDTQLVHIGKIFGTVLAIVSICVAPVVSFAPSGLYDFLQSCFGFFNVPILAAVIVGLFTRNVPARAAKVSIVMHVVLYSISKFIPALQNVHYLYVLAVLFVLNVAVMLLIGKISPRATPYVMQDVGAVDLTPWKYRKIAAIGALCLMCCVYLLFSPLGLAG